MRPWARASRKLFRSTTRAIVGAASCREGGRQAAQFGAAWRPPSRQDAAPTNRGRMPLLQVVGLEVAAFDQFSYQWHRLLG